MRRGSFHRVSHRRDVRVKTHAGVLDVKYDRVDACEHGIGRALGFSVEAINRQARRCVRGGSHVAVKSSSNSMLGTEKRYQFYARRMCQQVNRVAAVPIDSSLVGDETHALASQRGELLRFEHIDARKSVSAGCSLCRDESRMNTDEYE